MRVILSILSQRLHLMKVGLIDKAIKERKGLKHRILEIEQPLKETRDEDYFRGIKKEFEIDQVISVKERDTAPLLSKIMLSAEPILNELKPDFILLYGSDLAALAVALLAVQKKISLGHINAGLRNFDKSSPGEINTILVDHMSQLLFCSTGTTVGNLVNEGITSEIRVTGDLTLEVVKAKEREISERADELLKRYALKPKGYILADIRYRDNLSPERLSNIIEGLASSNKVIVLLTYGKLNEVLENSGIDCSRIRRIEDRTYLDAFALISNSEKVVCDSESVERDSYLYKKPVIVLRNTTVWNEVLTRKWMVLVDADEIRIREAIVGFNPSEKDYRSNLFGIGFKIADNIVEEISKNL